ELLDGADVFLTNIRPGALKRTGLDFETVATRNPRLVYGLITGYGESGPDAGRAAFDVAAFWARAGLAHLLTRPGDTPPFQRGGMGDHMAGMTLAGAVCAALVADFTARHGSRVRPHPNSESTPMKSSPNSQRHPLHADGRRH